VETCIPTFARFQSLLGVSFLPPRDRLVDQVNVQQCASRPLDTSCHPVLDCLMSSPFSVHVVGTENWCNDNAALSPPSLSIYSSVEQTASETGQKSFQARPFVWHCLLQESPTNLRVYGIAPVNCVVRARELMSIMCFILSTYHSCIERHADCGSFLTFRYAINHLCLLS